MFLQGTGEAEQLVWRKASFCSATQCIEVAAYDGVIALRDSKSPHGHVITFTGHEWITFIGAIKAGEFDDLG
jgi:Domain of unknown function (DUF397)